MEKYDSNSMEQYFQKFWCIHSQSLPIQRLQSLDRFFN